MRYIIIFLKSFSVQAQYTLVDSKKKIIKDNVSRIEAEEIAKKIKKKKANERFFIQTWINGRVKECEIKPKYEIDFV